MTGIPKRPQPYRRTPAMKRVQSAERAKSARALRSPYTLKGPDGSEHGGTWGIKQTPEQNLRAHQVVDAFKNARACMTTALRELEVQVAAGTLSEENDRQIRQLVNVAIRRLTALRPAALCDTCMTDLDKQPTCLICEATGSLTNEQMKERQ